VNINPLNSPRGSEAVSPIAPIMPRFLGNQTFVANPTDSVKVDGPASAEASQPSVDPKKLAKLRDEFKSSLSRLKGQTEDDKVAVRDLARMVNERSDLNSKEKEWLFANEMIAYTSDVAMQMTGWEKKGQPWTPMQQSRFEAVSDAFAAAKGLSETITPLVAKPDGSLPPGQPVPAQESASAGNASSSSVPSSDAPPSNAPPAQEPPPAPKDPLVEIWEMRRQEAQDMFNDYKAMMQKITEWKQRILASRISFFWKVYGMHAGFIAESWRR